MIVSRKKRGKITVDLTGPDGNAFVLLGLASNLCRQLGVPKDEERALLDDMRSSDYEHLVKALDDRFGSVLILER